MAQGGEFAFVVFQAAASADVLPAQTSSLLIAAVAVSMLVSPLLLVAIDKFLLPRYAHCDVPELDEISEQQDAPILIAGFGRYGQIVSRVLIAQGHPCTVLDHDAEMIEAARSFGYRVVMATPRGWTCYAPPVRPTPKSWSWQWMMCSNRWRLLTWHGSTSHSSRSWPGPAT